MEAQIGVRLAIRTTRGSQLTPAGIVVAEWAARLLEVADEIDAGLGSLRTEGRQRIRVVASQTIAEQLMRIGCCPCGPPTCAAVVLSLR